MCDPITLAMGGLQAASSAASISAQNSAAVKNDAHAKQAMNESSNQEQLGFIEKNRSLIQGGFDRILEGRAEEASAYTSAIQNGVQGNSVKAMLRASKQKTARSSGRTLQEQESLETQTDANLAHIRTTAVGRSNSVSTTGFGLGDVAGILAPIVQSELD